MPRGPTFASAITITTAFLMVAAHAARADTTFVALLDGAQVVPGGTGSPATGQGVFVLNDDATALTYTVDYAGLIGMAIVGADFRNGAAGVEGPLARRVDVSAATYPNGNLTGIWAATDPPSLGPLTPQLVSELMSGRIYVTIRTNDHGNHGEIRGQIVPEPACSLLFAAFAGLGLRRPTRL